MKGRNISITERFKRLTDLIEISKEIVLHSKLIPDEEKRIYLEAYEANLEDANYFLGLKRQNALKQIENEVLTPWQESFDEDSVRFWNSIKEKEIDIFQENKIENILKKGSIKSLGEYEFVQDAIVIYQQEGKITEDEANRLSEMLLNFEKKNNS